MAKTKGKAKAKPKAKSKAKPKAKKKPTVAPKKKPAPARAGLEFNHAMIYVTDIERSLGFYRDALGFRVVDTYPNAYARLVSPSGSTSIALHLVGEHGENFNPMTEGLRLYFEIATLDAFCASLEARGVVFDAPPKDMPWGWRHAYLRDPDGHELSLYWAGKKRFQPTTMG